MNGAKSTCVEPMVPRTGRLRERLGSLEAHSYIPEEYASGARNVVYFTSMDQNFGSFEDVFIDPVLG